MAAAVEALDYPGRGSPRRQPYEPPRRALGRRGGTTPALGAVINGIVEASTELGVSHIEMPATRERVWRAIQAAYVGGAG